VIGAVSHGAEVISDGNVHIYGTLRGRAIAGAKGYNEANIFCQKLEAELVSINGSYWISDSLQGEHWGSAVQIQQKNDSLEISALVKG
jgi:septum site-determining protein MinC